MILLDYEHDSVLALLFSSAIITNLVISLLISVVLTVAQMLLAPKRQQQQQQKAPKPEDGKLNTKQNVPSLSRAYGRVKKAGDYVFLEERNGALVEVTVLAGHRIEGFHQHYLHDELITVTGGGSTGTIIGPSHFVDPTGFSYMAMDHRLGLSLETAYNTLTTNFSDIWTADHRGDGLASVMFYFGPASERMFARVYPQGKPEHSAVLDGAWVYDPRTNQDPEDPSTWTFSDNLALIRLDHLTHVSGGKLSKSDMHMPDWEVAADVCDEVVLNRDDEEEPRYHGGLWYRYSDDQVEVASLLDEAAQLVVYERSDGKIGVHAGEMVEPDIRITTDDIIAFRYDANRRLESSVLAVRGQYTEPDAVYNTVDAAVFGDPYTGDDTQRTLTVDNQAVQYHNHMQRLQKLAMIRKNAPRVSMTVDFNVSEIRSIRERRWVRVHYPERGLDEAIVEITGRPKLSLHKLTYSFDGIVVPEDLYDFDPETEEGERPNIGAPVDRDGVPEPENFAISVAREIVAGTSPQLFVVGSWDHESDSLTYELQYQLADESEPAESVFSQPGDDEVRTPALRDGVEYQFRLRAISNGSPSDWTTYETVYVVSAYPNQAAVFDGTNDYLARGADLSGFADGKTGTISLWVKMTGGDGANQIFVIGNDTITAPNFSFIRDTANGLRLRARNAANTLIFSVNASPTIIANGTWHHVLASWDLAASAVKIYVDDVDVTGTPGTMTNDSIDYTTGNFYVGADNAAASKLNANLADVWFTDSFIDLTVTANRRKFANAGNYPVYLGATGELPTGTAPKLYLALAHDAAAASAFATNKGTGGNFTITGALTATAGPGI